METEDIRWVSAGRDHDGGYVSTLANQAEDWGLVPLHGCAWTPRAILRHVYIQTDTLLCHRVLEPAGTVVVS